MSAIDLQLLPAPDVIEQLDFEVVLAELKALIVAQYPMDQQQLVAETLVLESEPLTKVAEAFSYRELLLRQQFNERAQSLLLALAGGPDLDHLSAGTNTGRLTLAPGDPDAVPPIAPTYEPDDDLKRRTLLAWERLSVAGPAGAYIYHTLSAHADVADATAASPSPVDVVVTVLSRTGTGEPAAEVLAAVDSYLLHEDVRPLTDRVTVQAATIVPYAVEATLHFYSGPDRAVALAAAQASVTALTTSLRRLGRDINRSAIIAALHQPGVSRVDLISPAADVPISSAEAGYCTGIAITDAGVSE